MVKQFLRACSILVADQKGNGVEITPPGESILRARFTVGYQSTTPAAFHCRVYNLSNTTVQKITNLANEPFNRSSGLPAFQTSAKIIFKAGYGDISQIPVLFNGQVYQMRVGKERNTDTFLDIFAQDGSMSHYTDSMNTTFSKGYNNTDVYNALGASLGKWGVTTNPPPMGLDGPAAVRGKVLYGKTTSHITSLAFNNNFTWAIQDMQLQAIPKYSFAPGSLVVVNSETGMIGIPEQTDQGIQCTVLLNPAIKWGTQIHINQNDIVHLTNKDQGLVTSTTSGQATGVPPLNADGRYVVLHAEHTGDTRSNEWYTKFVCLTVDPTAVKPATPGIPPPPLNNP